MERILQQGLETWGLPTDAIPRLQEFSRLLLEKNRVMNLTAITDPADVARLHFLDCASLLTIADFPGKNVVDVGTGAGFPGMPLRLLEPDFDLTLLDSLGKRVDFLQKRHKPWISSASNACMPGPKNLPGSIGRNLTSPPPGPLPS